MELDELIVKSLFEAEKVKKDDLVSMYKINQANKTPLEKLLVQFKLVSREDVLNAKSQILEVESVLLNEEEIDFETTQKISKDMAKCYNLVCIGEENDTLTVAMHDPKNTAAIDFIKSETGKEVETKTALLFDIESIWEKVYDEKKNKLFFYKKSQEAKRPLRTIPTKFSLPGLAKNDDIQVEGMVISEVQEEEPPEKAVENIKEVTNSLRIKAQDDEDMKKSVDTIQREMEVLTILTRSATALNSVMHEEMILQRILETGMQICSAEGGSLLMLEKDTQELVFKQAIGPQSEGLINKRISIADTSIAGWVAVNRRPLAVNNTKEDERHYKELDKILGFETRSIACVPILWGGEIIGAMEILNKNNGDFDDQDLRYLGILTSQAAITLHNASLMEQYKNFYLEVVEVFIDCMETFNPDFREDAHQTAKLTSIMGQQLHLPKDQFENVCYAAFLLNIGMLKTPKGSEKEHPVIGSDMLARMSLYKKIVPLIRHHHERWDGGGYPDGLFEEAIPVGSRILAVAGDYIEGRRKKPDVSDDRYFNDFIKGFGTRYDPGLKLVFMSIMQP